MLQSIIVYGFLIISMFLLGSSRMNFSRREKYNHLWKSHVVLSLLIFTLISALRYDVGVDYLFYLDNYQSLSDSFDIYDNGTFELGYNFIQKQFYNLGLHSSVLFGFLAFLQIVLIYYTFKKEQFLYGCISFVLITSGAFFTLMNEIRQSLVVCLFIYAVQFANKEGFIRYFLIAVLGYMFHTSALIFVPLYILLLLDRDYFKSVRLQLLIFGLVFAMGESSFIFDILRERNDLFNQIIAKDNYIDIYQRIGVWEKEYVKGIRFYLNVFIYVLLIVCSGKVKVYFKSENIIKYYNLFFVGSLAYLLTYNNTLFQRPFRYFMLFEIVIGGYTLFYFWKRKKILAFIYIFVSVLYFTAYVYSDHHTFYKFFWQF